MNLSHISIPVPKPHLSTSPFISFVLFIVACVGMLAGSGPVRFSSICPAVQNTLNFTIVYGAVILNGSPAPIGTIITAKSPRGDIVGCFQTSAVGDYGAMYLYGEDKSVNPPIPGMRTGELVAFYINNYLAIASPTVAWYADKEIRLVNLTSTAVMAPGAAFTADVTTGVAPLTVQFTNLSTGTISNYQWDFGDGTAFDTRTNPSHTFLNTGTYSVKLTVTGPGGIDSLTRSGYIVVGGAQPQASFTATPVAGVSPLTVNFSNLSASATSYFWEFGDGQTSTSASPAHVYVNTSGQTQMYSVRLTASNGAQTDTMERVAYVTVYAPVAADFTASPTSGTAPLEVFFTNTSTGDWTTAAWSFGDGSPGSIEQNPTHIYNAPGSYPVSLTVSGPGGTHIRTREAYITVSYSAPTANFTAVPQSGIAPLTVNFTNLSTEYSLSLWGFGDSATSNLANPTHTYVSKGVYTVSLSVVGPGGTNTLARESYITVYQPVRAGFTATPLTGAAPLSVQFNNQSTGDYSNLSWDFGDGQASTETNPTHIYPSQGEYTVILTATGPGGTDTFSLTSKISVVTKHNVFLPLIIW